MFDHCVHAIVKINLNARQLLHRWRAFDMVQEYLAGRQSGKVFITNLGTPLKDGDVNRDVLKPLCGEIGIPVGTLYAFRHGRVSVMQEAGVNEKIILTEIGHTTLRMTRRYTHFSHKSRRATAGKRVGRKRKKRIA